MGHVVDMDSASAPAAHIPLTDPALYINRELSWIAFNYRVLAQAEDDRHPLLERVRFLAIVATNLDEFFMIRAAALMRKRRTGIEDVSPDGLSTSEQLVIVRREAALMTERQARCWNRMLRPALAQHGIRVLEPAEYSPAVSAYLESSCAREVLPVLTPLAFNPGHPFPHISNLSKNLAVVVKHGGVTKFARVKLPDILPRFLALPPHLSTDGAYTFVWIEDAVRANVQALFPGTQVKGAYLFRVIRDADLVIQEDEADDLLESVDEGLKQRRHGALAMLQVEAATPRRVLNILIENFEIDEDTVVRFKDRLGIGDWMELVAVPRPELKYSPFVAPSLWPLDAGEQVFEEIRHHDRLVHHPFQSFSAVEVFLRAAIEDPHVIAIKMTLYRIGADSPLVDLLIEAAELGKQVAVLVELKARFDERNNIRWANRLEEAGIHVVYGLLNLKTHCKLCLVVRKEIDGIRRYVHVGTGNYNLQTARAYTDLGLFTARMELVEDVSELFNYLTGYSSQREYRGLLVAPVSLRSGVTALIDREAALSAEGRPARIIMKVNAVTDPEMIRSLYRASQAGVTVDLIVRGVCCLRPGVAGVSDRISVRSIVGRFLEHSRIFWFGNGGEPDMYLSSADLMERNLDRRVEVLCPIRNQRLAEHLRTVVLDAYLADTDRAQILTSTGEYVWAGGSATTQPGVNSQNLLLESYLADAKPHD